MDVIAQFGGLHRFEGWTRPILTDSGGFQVWSLGANAKVSEEGVAFQSPVNGDKLLLTPEVSMQIQRVLDSDIAMQFDECTAYEVEGRVTGEAEARALDADEPALGACARAPSSRGSRTRTRSSASSRAACSRSLREESVGGARRARPARLRDRRRQRRRAEGRDAAHRRPHAAPAAGDASRAT